MGESQHISQLILKAFFYFILPGVVIFFRIKKKIKTGFAAGLLLLSFVLGILSSATFQKDPVETFIENINNNDRETKASLKILVQYGPDYIKKIDENKIIYKDVYKELKEELINEYSAIAKDYYEKFSIMKIEDCSEYITQKNNYGNLLHAMKLIEYSESIGGKHDELKDKLAHKIDSSREIMKTLEEKCD